MEKLKGGYPVIYNPNPPDPVIKTTLFHQLQHYPAEYPKLYSAPAFSYSLPDN